MSTSRRSLSADDITAKRFEANQLFTPSAPIAVAELFAGRQAQIERILAALSEQGRHVILYGERGVGKSSLAQIVPFLVPKGPRQVRHIRVQAFPNDSFSDVARNIFRRMQFEEDLGEGHKLYNVAEFHSGDIGADDFVREMETFSQSEIPIIVIDEFNEIKDRKTASIISNVIKYLSDSGSHVTMVVVGVADSVTDLMEQHESIQRCTEQILMPRMPVGERKEVLERRLNQLAMTISGDGKWKILNLSKGLPAYVHALGKHAVLSALNEKRLYVTEEDVDAAIHEVLISSQQTFKDAYERATRSNQPGSLFRHVLTACALAKVDDSGFFTPTAVKEPLSAILKKNVDIANYQNHLKDFAEERRGSIFERIGEPRNYRFRFDNPAMQPYVIMRGIRDGIVDEKARQALSSPEQPDLFPT
jgi:Cdc6-like AAA superfamily ATPase